MDCHLRGILNWCKGRRDCLYRVIVLTNQRIKSTTRRHAKVYKKVVGSVPSFKTHSSVYNRMAR